MQLAVEVIILVPAEGSDLADDKSDGISMTGDDQQNRTLLNDGFARDVSVQRTDEFYRKSYSRID